MAKVSMPVDFDWRRGNVRRQAQSNGPVLPVGGSVDGFRSAMPYFSRPDRGERTGGNVDVPRYAWGDMAASRKASDHA